MGPIRLSTDAVVVLAGPSASGKSTWAARWFRPEQIVASDDLRAVVGTHTGDLRASDDAFAVLDEIVSRRIERGLLTVIDTLGMNLDLIDRWRSLAGASDRPIHLVRFDEKPATCRKRNAARTPSVPAKVLSAQLSKWEEVGDEVAARFDAVHAPAEVHVVGRSLLGTTGTGADHQLGFGLLVSRFDGPDIAGRLAEIAREAETAGFGHLWVMDHFIQIPQVGREWDSMLESTTTLGWLAAHTQRVGVGALVSGITHRNIGVLGHALATLDVLSGGRARCGLGVGWFAREHRAIGMDLPALDDRYALLEDALEFLPLLWGPGAPSFEGRRFSTPEAIGYPRPIQESIPILVGGSGPRRTLRLAAKYGDACNLFGEPDTVAELVEVLRQHCVEANRDPAEVEVTQLSSILVGADHADLRERLGQQVAAAPAGATPEDLVERTNAGTVAEHIDRFGRLADAGVETVIVSLADVDQPGSIEAFAEIIDEFGP